MERAIEVKGLTKYYKQKRRKIKALNSISFEVYKGEIFGFLGPNGAGKSTTIKIILDLIRPDKGDVFICGINSRDPSCRSKLGFLPENPSYIDTLSGKQLLEFSAKMHGFEDIKDKVLELLKEFDLLDAKDRMIRKYSKGMIQKIGFASVLIFDPEILILDEPMSGLDPIGRFLFKKKFKELKERGKTIFFSSHILPDVEDLCDRVAIINKGEIVKILRLEELKSVYKEKNLEELFVKVVEELK